VLVDRWGDVAGSADHVVKTYPMTAVSPLDVGAMYKFIITQYQ
jgi:hypothetical protein